MRILPVHHRRLVNLFSAIGAIMLKTCWSAEDAQWESGFVPPPGVIGDVFASVTLGEDLYIGGRILVTGTNEIRYLARWDGTNWHGVGGGVNGPVYSLAVQRKALVVGGQFTQ